MLIVWILKTPSISLVLALDIMVKISLSLFRMYGLLHQNIIYAINTLFYSSAIFIACGFIIQSMIRRNIEKKNETIEFYY